MTTGAPDPTKPGGAIRRVLLTSDLTAYSDRAFDRAVMLAEEHGAALRFLNVVDPTLLPEAYLRRGIRDAQARLEEELRDSGVADRIDASARVVAGQADKAVLEEAVAMQADLIVMGLSHAGMSGMVRGTTADKVVRRAACPVLVVKARARRPYARVLAAIDLAPPARRALELALRLFPAAGFTLVHVDESVPAGRGGAPAPAGSERRQLIEDMVAARCAAAGREGPGRPGGPALTLVGGKAMGILQEQVAQVRPDLVVLGTHGRTGVSGLFLGSVAETLLEVLPCDMLVTRA